MNQSANTILVVVGRVLLALMFVLSGYGKLTGIQATAGFIASVGLPAPTALAVFAGLFELVAGVLLAIGFKARWAALGLAVFTVIASFIFHAWWSLPADQQYVQQLLFMKNMAVAGGMFMVAALGPGSPSLDMRGVPAMRHAG